MMHAKRNPFFAPSIYIWSCLQLVSHATTHGGRVEERGSVAGYSERSYDDEVHQVTQQERNHHQE